MKKVFINNKIGTYSPYIKYKDWECFLTKKFKEFIGSVVYRIANAYDMIFTYTR